MKHNTLLILKQYLILLFISCFVGLYAQKSEPRFKTFHQGLPFTSITIDQDKNIWAGTDKKGLFFMDQREIIGEQQPTFKLLPIGEFVKLSDLRIQSLAADQSGNIWVGHAGINFNNVQGGLERIEIRSRKVTHLYPDRDTRGIGFMERDGIATLNSQQVVVDENNKVWVAHKSHSIFSGASPGNPGVFILTPGTFSSRRADDYQGKFNSISTWKDREEKNEDPYLPYPAYTYNPGPEGTPQGRNLQSIATDNSFVWISVFPYEKHGTGKFFQSRLLQYTLEGVFVKETTIQEAGFSGGVFNGIYSNNEEVWATSSFVDGGFSVLKDGKWYNINSRALFPAGTRFNQGAIWGDDYGRVYLGTNNGLIVYNVIGSVLSEKSYTLYTKDSCDSSNVRCIKDIDMLSNNIIAGIIEENSENLENTYYSWIATDKGVMRFNLMSEEAKVTVYHNKEKYDNSRFSPLEYLQDNFVNDEDNYISFTTLRDPSNTYDPNNEYNKPSFAADGTISSVFRYHTNNPTEVYNKFKTGEYSIKIDSSINFNSKESVARYGKFSVKQLNPNKENLDYVDIIYQHPSYIKESDFEYIKSKIECHLVIWDKSNPKEVKLIFTHPVKISLPPVLLAHGVWSSVNSLDTMEEVLLARGYKKSEIIKVWRTDDQAAENYIYDDFHIIPTKIKELRKRALGAKVSAGAVSVIAHSRGGLYTRAYIQGICHSNITSLNCNYPYNNDINRLITVNTPHSGSPLANAVMDKRIVTPNLTVPLIDLESFFDDPKEDLRYVLYKKVGPKSIGDFFSFAVPKADQKENWGARHLKVQKDNLSQNYLRMDRFIEQLNPKGGTLLKGVPIHAIAATFSSCDAHPFFCKQLEITDVIKTDDFWVSAFLYLIKGTAKELADVIPKTINNVLLNIHNMEPNDLIVPISSMRGGLGPQYVSLFENFNIIHIDANNTIINGEPVLNYSGVMASQVIHDEIVDYLLKDNTSSPNSKFSKNGLTPPPLTYNFAPNFKGLKPQKNRTSKKEGKIVIDPGSFTSMTSGNEVSFNVYQENLDEITVFYEFPSLNQIHIYNHQGKTSFKNTFSFDIPEEFFGKFSVTAYGFNDDGLVTMHTLEPTVQLPKEIILQSIRFSSPEEVEIYERDTYAFDILGTFSDGTERIINSLNGIEIIIKDSTVLESVDVQTLKALIPGETTFKAKVGLLTTSATNVKVIENPALYRNLVLNFYSEYEKTGPVKLNWETYHEYESKYFTLERSENNDQNFVEINRQLGKGIFYEPTDYRFVDNTDAKHVFYRLRLYDINDQIVYTQVIKVDKETLSTIDENLFKGKLSLVPNPLKSSIGSLFVQSDFADKDATLNIYDISGRFVYTKKYSILQGNQKIDFEIPSGLNNGVYLVQLKTINYAKTLKLILQR